MTQLLEEVFLFCFLFLKKHNTMKESSLKDFEKFQIDLNNLKEAVGSNMINEV